MALRLRVHDDDEPRIHDGLPEVRIIDVVGERGTLQAAASAPPGAPVTVVTRAREFEARVKGCQRSDIGGFLLTVRWVNLSNQARAELTRLTASAPHPRSDQAKNL